jgi:hypothetical protein
MMAVNIPDCGFKWNGNENDANTTSLTLVLKMKEVSDIKALSIMVRVLSDGD